MHFMLGFDYTHLNDIQNQRKNKTEQTHNFLPFWMGNVFLPFPEPSLSVTIQCKATNYKVIKIEIYLTVVSGSSDEVLEFLWPNINLINLINFFFIFF